MHFGVRNARVYMSAPSGGGAISRLWLFVRASALASAAISGVLWTRLNLGSVDCEKLGYPIAHDMVFFKTAVFAAVHLDHAAVVNLGANNAADLQHLQQLHCELEAAALASLGTVGTDVAKIMWTHDQQRFDTGILDIEWKLELLLQ